MEILGIIVLICSAAFLVASIWYTAAMKSRYETIVEESQLSDLPAFDARDSEIAYLRGQVRDLQAQLELARADITGLLTTQLTSPVPVAGGDEALGDDGAPMPSYEPTDEDFEDWTDDIVPLTAIEASGAVPPIPDELRGYEG